MYQDHGIFYIRLKSCTSGLALEPKMYEELHDGWSTVLNQCRNNQNCEEINGKHENQTTIRTMVQSKKWIRQVWRLLY